MRAWTRIEGLVRVHGTERAGALFALGVFFFFLLLPVRTDATAAIILMTLAGLWTARGTGAPRFMLRGSPRLAVWGLILFLAVAAFASALHPATLPKFPRLLLWGCCACSGMLLSICFPDHDSRYFWALFLGVAGSLAAAVIFLGYGAESLWHDGRLKLFAIHPSRLGLYCVVCFFFFLHRFVSSEGVGRLCALAALLFVFFILFKTNTRGNLLMLPVGVACLVAATPRGRWKGMLPALALCLIVGSGALWLNRSSDAGARLIRAVTATTTDSTFRTRLPIWEAGWESFKQAPLAGNGVQSYLGLHAAYLTKHKAEWDVRYNGLYEPSVKQAHNIVLGRLVETGILGTAGFFAFYLGGVAAAWRGPEKYRWLTAPLVFYLGMNMLDDGLFRMNDAFILFVAGTALGFRPEARGRPCRVRM